MPQPPNPHLSNADWLRTAYTRWGWTQQQIAEHVGTSQSAVSKALRRHRIPAGVRPDSLVWDDDWLRTARLDRHLTTAQIAAEAHCDESTVVHHLHRLGLPTRR
ncbi:hypothetical protein DVS28_b0313 (plasmid) [Euzebya pacifica]|uniref:ParB/Spo0J HTH domain-containing protein n=1 Tax=Euzebya pacifica TaxID=1608957 RepID=A0A346Y6I6_9ACTN|nr:helix-turn-helix transcriptional regulator [Euzebya pacifica]AXV10083.1 hypothetical protein DVS28_b0313 [Euzebya pacifica]